MWRTPDGNRALTETEWGLFRVGLERLWDYIEDDSDEDAGLSETGVRVFDVLQPEQKLALLAEVAQALRDPAIPMPHHTAANEGAVAAIFAVIRQGLEEELAFSDVEETASTEVRSRLLAAAADSEEPPEDLPGLADTDVEEWGGVLEAIEGRIFWDADFEMGDDFLDQPPDESQELHLRAGIDPEYFTAIPREPDEAGMIAVRQTLTRLLGRPVPDDDGAYPALEDLYHHLIIGPCTQEEIDAWEDHPWMREIGMSTPEWDCDYATWVAEFRGAVPATPFTVSEDEMVPAEGDGSWPDNVRVELHGGAWVIRDDSGDFWCDVLANGWFSNPDDDNLPVLTFPSRAEAEAAHRQANRMYGERAARHEAAMARLGHLDGSAE
jgi:hypothetical protein